MNEIYTILAPDDCDDEGNKLTSDDKALRHEKDDTAHLITNFKRKGTIPQPHLLVKDHKDPDANVDFPTRLVIPATNFTAAFSKLGYMGIKKVLDDHGVNYAKHTIVQSSDLKEKLEACSLTRDNVTLMLLDIVNMYPSIRVKLIKNALKYYAKDLPAEARETIDMCMDIVQF
eukprot:4014245-Ditylum_brightwellii.AAC.1